MKSLALAMLMFTGCGIEDALCREDALCFECKVSSDGGLVIGEAKQMLTNGNIGAEDDGPVPGTEKRLIEIKNAEASCYVYKCAKDCER